MPRPGLKLWYTSVSQNQQALQAMAIMTKPSEHMDQH